MPRRTVALVLAAAIAVGIPSVALAHPKATPLPQTPLTGDATYYLFTDDEVVELWEETNGVTTRGDGTHLPLASGPWSGLQRADFCLLPEGGERPVGEGGACDEGVLTGADTRLLP